MTDTPVLVSFHNAGTLKRAELEVGSDPAQPVTLRVDCNVASTATAPLFKVSLICWSDVTRRDGVVHDGDDVNHVFCTAATNRTWRNAVDRVTVQATMTEPELKEAYRVRNVADGDRLSAFVCGIVEDLRHG